MKYLNDAQEIVEIMADRGLSALTSTQINSLADHMEILEFNGREQNFYETEHHFPNPETVNKNIDKLRQMISRLENFLESDSVDVQQAIVFCAGKLGQFEYQNLPLNKWLSQTRTALEQMPPPSERFVIEPEKLIQKSRFEYKTFVMGAALPELFNVLYGAKQFGTHTDTNDYNCPGIAFINDVLSAIGFEEQEYSNISKAIQRCKKEELSYLAPF